MSFRRYSLNPDQSRIDSEQRGEELKRHAQEDYQNRFEDEDITIRTRFGTETTIPKSGTDRTRPKVKTTHTVDTYDKGDRMFGASSMDWLLPRKKYGDQPTLGFEAETMSQNDAEAERAYWGRFFRETTDDKQRTAWMTVKCGRNASGDILGGGLCEECSSRGLLRF